MKKNSFYMATLVLLFVVPSESFSQSHTAIVDGRYFWERIFVHDNRAAPPAASITISETVTESKTVSVKQVLSSKFSISSSFKYESKSSAEIKFKGVTAGGGIAYSSHIELANELARTSTVSSETSSSKTEVKTYVIPGGAYLEGYQLIYSADGMSTRTNIINTSSTPNKIPSGDIIVKLEFEVEHQIPGLSKILNTLSSISPGSANRSEWASIRNSIVASSHKDDFARFKDIVTRLSTIRPGRDNTVEWSNIRSTSNEILRDWADYDKVHLFKKLLTRLMSTTPGRANRREWGTIRRVSGRIHAGLDQII